MRIAKFFSIISGKAASSDATKNDNSTTPLHEAAMDNNVVEAKRLIDNGAEVNAKNNDGTTPLDMAMEWESAEVAKVLIENGATE